MTEKKGSSQFLIYPQKLGVRHNILPFFSVGILCPSKMLPIQSIVVFLRSVEAQVATSVMLSSENRNLIKLAGPCYPFH